MFSPQTLFKGIVSRLLPQFSQDGSESEKVIRLNSYGEQLAQLIMASQHGMVDEGSFFTTTNPTPGTALALPVAAAFVNTNALYVIYNTADASDPAARNIYLVKIKHIYTVAPATATGSVIRVALDQTNRAPTAGQALLVGGGASANPGAQQPGKTIRQAVAKIWGFTGAAVLTVPAPGPNNKYVALGAIDTIPVIGGERCFIFGGFDTSSSAQTCRMAPVVVPPGWYCVIHGYFPGNATTGASLEPEIAWFER